MFCIGQTVAGVSGGEMQGRWKKFFSQLPHMLYHDMTEKSNHNVFGSLQGIAMTEIVPLLFKKYFNVMCMDVLQMDKKITQPTSAGSAHGRDVEFTGGQNSITVPCTTPSHSLLLSTSLNTSSTSSVLKLKIKTYSISNHSKYFYFFSSSDHDQLEEFCVFSR